jgi:hypothetical protein
MVIMLVLSIVLAYPVFMLCIYLMAKVIFTPLEKQAEDQRRERAELLIRARRVRRSDRLVHA